MVEVDSGLLRFPEHLERYLGPITRGWRHPDDSIGLHVALFRDRPIGAVSTFVTMGLSRHILPMSDNRQVRQELLMAVESRFDSEVVAEFLLRCAANLTSEHRALLRGEVVRLSSPIAGTAMKGLYVSIPIVYEESLRTSEVTKPATVLVWLVPIHRIEGAYVEAHGWNAFESALENENPDLYDLNRSPIREAAQHEGLAEERHWTP